MKNNKSQKNYIKPESKKNRNWVDQIRRNLKAGLKEKYGDLRLEPSSK